MMRSAPDLQDHICRIHLKIRTSIYLIGMKGKRETIGNRKFQKWRLQFRNLLNLQPEPTVHSWAGLTFVILSAQLELSRGSTEAWEKHPRSKIWFQGYNPLIRGTMNLLAWFDDLLVRWFAGSLIKSHARSTRAEVQVLKTRRL